MYHVFQPTHSMYIMFSNQHITCIMYSVFQSTQNMYEFLFCPTHIMYNVFSTHSMCVMYNVFLPTHNMYNVSCFPTSTKHVYNVFQPTQQNFIFPEKHQMLKKKILDNLRRWKASSVSGAGDGLTAPSEASVFWSLPRVVVSGRFE